MIKYHRLFLGWKMCAIATIVAMAHAPALAETPDLLADPTVRPDCGARQQRFPSSSIWARTQCSSALSPASSILRCRVAGGLKKSEYFRQLGVVGRIPGTMGGCKMETTRRELFGAGASAAFGLFPLRNISAALAQPGGASATQQAWDSGELLHVLPTSSHDRILIKVQDQHETDLGLGAHRPTPAL
jgi:hypothetical protein